MKNIFKRATALMLSLLMVFSVCSTSLVIYAQDAQQQASLEKYLEDFLASLNKEGTETDKEHLVYVSLGDSMTNGYGIEGYEGESGIFNYGIDTYANEFAAWLAGVDHEKTVNDQIIFEGDKRIVEHRQLAMSGMRAEDLHWILNFDHSDAELAYRAVDSKTDIGGDSDTDYHHWCSSESCNAEWKELYEGKTELFGNCTEECETARMRYRWYHDTENFGFTAGDYRTWDDLLKPTYRFADGAAEILHTYYDEENDAYGYFTSKYAEVTGTNGITIAQNAINNKNQPKYPDDEADIGEMAGYVWLQVATEFYQDSVKNADVISLALGNTNFGTFMFQTIKEIISGSDTLYSPRNNDFYSRYKIEDVYYVAQFDEEMQAKVDELLAMVDGIVDANFDSDLLPELPDWAPAEFDTMLDYIKYVIKYCVLSYIVNYIGVITDILAVNPDVQLIQIALMNAYAASDDPDSTETSMADLIDMLYIPLNAFVAALPTYLQKDGANPDATFYFADCGIVETMTDVFGDDYYKDAQGNYIDYPGLNNIGYTVNANSTARQRFVYWISGYADCGYMSVGACYCRHDGYKNNFNSKYSYGEMWKHVLLNVTDSINEETGKSNAHTDYTDYSKAAQHFFGQYDLACIMDKSNQDYQRLVDYLNLSAEERLNALKDETVLESYSQTKATPQTASTKYDFTYKVKDWAFSCEMYLAFEDATIRAGKSSVSVANLGKYGSFNLSACEDAFDKFYSKNGITSMTDSSVTFNSYEDVQKLFKSLSDELVADPTSNIMLAMANRMEIGTGIGGHTSAGGHHDMFLKIAEVCGEGFTAQDQTEKNIHDFLWDNYPNLMESITGTDVSGMDDLDIIIAMLKLSKNEALAGVDLDALEAQIRAAIAAYANSHNAEQEAAAKAAVYALMGHLYDLAVKVTGTKYTVNADSYYVSLGDSNVNGYGLDDYEEGTDYGLGQIVDGAAPVELAKKLYGTTDTTKFAQLAQGSLRSKDMLALLTGVSDKDAYWMYEIDGRLLVPHDLAATSAKYIEAIKAADLVSIAVGGGDVTTFVGRQVDLVLDKDDTTKPIAMNWAALGYEAEALTELNELLNLAVPIADELGLLDQYLPEGMESIENPAEFARVLVESLLFGYASYNYYYPQVLAEIKKINPDAQLLIIGMFNPVDDWNTTINLDGEEIFFNIGGATANIMASANLQNLAFALQNDNTSFIDISNAETFLDADIKSGKVTPTFDVYYKSILEGNGKEVHANANGHAYIYAQLLDAIDGAEYDAEIEAILADFYDALNAGYLSTQEKLAAIGKAYAALDEKGVLNEYPIVKVIEEIYVALAAEKLINDDMSLAIVINVYEKLLDRKLDSSELREIVGYIYFTVLGAVRKARGGELNFVFEELDANDRLTILEIVYDKFVDNEIIPADAPGISDIKDLYDDVKASGDLTPAQLETLVTLAVDTYVVNETLGQEEIMDLASECVEEVFNNPDIPAEKKVNLFNKVVETLNNVVGDAGAVVPGAPALPDLTIVNKVLAALEAEGLLTHDQASKLIEKALTTILSGNIDAVKLVDELYAIVYNEGFDAERTAKIVLVIVDTLYHDEEFIEFADAYYAIALNYVLNSNNKSIALEYIGYAKDAVANAIAAVNGYAVAPEHEAAKAALLAELAETLDTLKVAEDIIANDKINGIYSTVDAILTLKDELLDHYKTLSALGLELGLAADPYIQNAIEKIMYYIDLADTSIIAAYNWLVTEVDTFVNDYLAFVETVGAEVDKFDTAIGAAVRKFMIETPADALAIICQYGKTAAIKLAVDAAEAAGDIYKEAMTLAGLLAQYGTEIYGAVENSDECKAIIAKLNTLYGQIEDLIAAAAGAPAATAAALYEQIDLMKEDALELAGDFWNAAVKAVSVADPYVGKVLADACLAFTNSLGIIDNTATEYGKWFLIHAEEMCGALLLSLTDNWTELFDVAWPIIVQKVTDLYNKIKDYIVNYDYDALIQKIIDAAVKFAPELDAYLYDFFYNNPDKVEAFFLEYGDEILELAEKYGEYGLAIIGLAYYAFGEDFVEYAIANPDVVIAGVIAWAQKYGMRVLAIIDVYAKYFKLYEKAIAYAPELDAQLYAFFYNNPDKVVAFFTEYGDEIEALWAKYGDYALVVIGYALVTYGPELAEYVINNPEEAFAGLVEWTKKYGKRVADILQVYAEYLGLCQPVQEELANLRAQLADLYKQLEELYKKLETAVGEEYNKILGYIDQILDLIAKIEAQINVLMAKLQALIDALNQLNEALKQLIRDGIDAIGAIQQALNKVAYTIYDLVNVLSEDVAGQIDALIKNIKDYLNNAYDSAILADYIIDKDSKYVAFGDNTLAAQLFAAALAAKVAEKNAGYTYKFDISNAKDGAKITDLMAVIMSNPAAIADADLISIGYSYDKISEETIDIFFDLGILGTASIPTEVDWSKLLGSDIANEVIKVLAQIEAELMANGLDKTLAQVAPAELANYFTSDITIAEAAMTALEYFAYNAVEYAVLMPQAVTMINQINPEALVMVNAISNPIAGATLALPEFSLNVAFGDYLDYVVDIIYIESLALAAINDSVVFATATDVETTFTDMVINNENFLPILAEIMNSFIAIDTTEVGSQTIAAKMIAALNITVQDSALLGDVNHDGEVTLKDALLIARYEIGLTNDLDLTVADVDGDGYIGIKDAFMVARYEIGLVTSFPAAK